MLSISKFGKDATNKIIDDKWDTCGGGIRSMYYLTDTKWIGCNEEFPRPDGKGNEQGHAGNGYVKTTPLWN